jgi:hypothetical protein
MSHPSSRRDHHGGEGEREDGGAYLAQSAHACARCGNPYAPREGEPDRGLCPACAPVHLYPGQPALSTEAARLPVLDPGEGVHSRE